MVSYISRKYHCGEKCLETKEMLGKPMTSEQKVFLEELREKVLKGEITVKEGHEIWNKKYKLWNYAKR